MKLTKSYVRYAILSLIGTLLVVFLSGCVPTTLPTPRPAPAPAPVPAPPPEPAPVPPPTEPVVFELKKWEVVADRRSAALQVSFSATKSLEFVLTDPVGVKVGSEYVELGVTGARLQMAGYGETPPEGEYTLLVKRLGQFVDSITFNFEGANLEVINVEASWRYSSFTEDYGLEELTIVVVNHGDLPAYIYEATVKLDGKAGELHTRITPVLPGKEVTVTAPTYISNIESGKYELMLKLKDSAGETIASYSGAVKPRR